MKSKDEVEEKISKLQAEFKNLEAEALLEEDPVKKKKISMSLKVHVVLIEALKWVLK